MFPPVVILAIVAAGLVPAATQLAAARWPRRSPAAAILLWQAMGLGWGWPRSARWPRSAPMRTGPASPGARSPWPAGQSGT